MSEPCSYSRTDSEWSQPRDRNQRRQQQPREEEEEEKEEEEEEDAAVEEETPECEMMEADEVPETKKQSESFCRVGATQLFSTQSVCSVLNK